MRSTTVVRGFAISSRDTRPSHYYVGTFAKVAGMGPILACGSLHRRSGGIACSGKLSGVSRTVRLHRFTRTVFLLDSHHA